MGVIQILADYLAMIPHKWCKVVAPRFICALPQYYNSHGMLVSSQSLQAYNTTPPKVRIRSQLRTRVAIGHRGTALASGGSHLRNTESIHSKISRASLR